MKSITNKEKESLATTIQIIASIVSIGTVIISILLLYNECNFNQMIKVSV